jgi:prevent-host-death family protein
LEAVETALSRPILDKPINVATMATRKEAAMSAVGIKELKNRLTQYLRRVKQGEEVIVTERGKPVALIQPIQSAERPASLEARLARLAALGLVTLPTHKPLKRVRPVKVSGPPISKTILEDRR